MFMNNYFCYHLEHSFLILVINIVSIIFINIGYQVSSIKTKKTPFIRLVYITIYLFLFIFIYFYLFFSKNL